MLATALLAGCGSESEADRLSAALEGEQRREVLRRLIAEVDDPAAAPALVPLFEHLDAGVRYDAAATHWRLTRSEEPGLRLLLDAILRGDEAAVRALPPDTYPATFVASLERACVAGEPNRLRCIQALGAAGAASSMPLLLDILEAPAAPGTGLHTEAAWSLYRIDRSQARRALSVLLPAYREGNVFSRGRLASRIAAIGTEEPELVRAAVDALLSDPDEDRQAAGRYLLEQITPR